LTSHRATDRLVGNKILLAGAFLLAILIQPLVAQGWNMIRTDEVVVLYEEPLRGAAEVAADGYDALKVEIETLFGWKVDFVPTVVLMKERAEFQRITGNNPVVAIAAPDKDLIIIDYSRMHMHPFSLGTTLKHELCHLLLHHAIDGGNLPAWLDEGVAQWASGGPAEIIKGGRDSILEAASLADSHITLSSLTKGFAGDRESLSLAYAASRSLVDFIVSEFGKACMVSMLHHLKEGDGVDAAAVRSLGVSMADLERRWHDDLRKRSSWFPYLTSNFDEILLSVAALLTIGAFLRLAFRRRRYRDDDLLGR
jgi:hypothetical protein